VKNIILLGPPGSGKGTQSERICAKYGWTALSTGQIMRQEIQDRSPLGLQIKDLIAAGSLVPDHLVMDVLTRWFNAHKDRLKSSGAILDGFPRTLNQAQSLQKTSISLTQVHCFNIPDHVIVERLSGRRVHMASGRTYHIVNNPPKREGLDDLTSEPLVQRVDDNPQTIEKRLQEYHLHTAPLIAFYQALSSGDQANLSFFNYDATQEVDLVFSQLERNLLS
jgi:adenylate kinase